MSPPELSIVVPVRNGMPYLPDAIGSALAELPDDAELIVRDNRSTDGTAEWLATLRDPRVRVITVMRISRAGENWTAVAREATGEYRQAPVRGRLCRPRGGSAGSWTPRASQAR